MANPRTTKRKFLSNLKKSGLFSPSEFKQVISEMPEDGGNIAARLINSGAITRYQAEQILLGNTDGLVVGQYTLLRPLGKGGLGRVYKAIHKPMNRVVAVKVLSPRWIKADKAKELFEREVLAIGRLVHPNIVTAFDASISGDSYYLVMEYVDGPDLEKLVKKKGPIRYNIASEIMRQTALGLQCAYELGMVHRDIKPGNIIVQRNPNNPKNPWQVKIVDFGLARLQAATSQTVSGIGTILTKENTVMGTPDYLSPEQAKDLHEVDIRSDLYSLGCTFYFLLTGSVPFPGGSSLEKLLRHSESEPRPIAEISPKVPSPVIKIVQRLMAKNPDDRFQTPGELAMELADYSISAAKSKLFLQSESDEHVSLESSQENQTEDKTPPEEPASAVSDTPPSANSPTPLPKSGRRGKDKPACQEDNTAAKGLLIALGMVILIMLVALILSYF